MSSEAMEVRDAAVRYVPQAEQDVPLGYKRTEVGVIPVDWRIQELEKISEFITKGSTPTTYGFKWESQGVLFLRSECVSDAGLDLAQSMFISEKAHQLLRRSEVHNGDILITITGNVGRVIYLTGVDTANINQHIARVRITSSDVDAKYVFHYLSQESVRRYFSKITTGQAYPQISLEQVRGAEVPLPPLYEQLAIATALSDVDALITALDKLIAKKRAIKIAAMQQLLTGKTRLPGFTGEWETKRLGELAEIISGGTPKSSVSEYWGGGIHWCTPTDITKTRGMYIDVTERTISAKGLAASSAQLLPPRSILLCTRATIGEMKIAKGPIATNQGFKSLVCKEQVANEFLYYKLLMEKKRLIEKASGSTFLEISKKDVVEFEIEIPDIKEQTAIAKILSDMDAEIAALEARRDKTRAIKQGMMQQLLTGRVRLI